MVFLIFAPENIFPPFCSLLKATRRWKHFRKHFQASLKALTMCSLKLSVCLCSCLFLCLGIYYVYVDVFGCVSMFHRFQSLIFRRSNTHTHTQHKCTSCSYLLLSPPTHTHTLTQCFHDNRSVIAVTRLFHGRRINHYMERFPGDSCLVTGRIGVGGWWVRHAHSGRSCVTGSITHDTHKNIQIPSNATAPLRTHDAAETLCVCLQE